MKVEDPEQPKLNGIAFGPDIIGPDITTEAIAPAKKALQCKHRSATRQKVEVGNARRLSSIEDIAIDLVLTHRPYVNIVRYSEGKMAEDLC